MTPEPDYEVDVAVVGGGACGLMTALRAAQNPDLRVAVFEKSTRHGCNSQLSSGSLAASGTRFQRDVGIDDTPERQAEEIVANSGDPRSRDVVLALCRVSSAFVEWLADELDYPIELGTDMPRSGFSVPRLHTDRGREGGQRLISAMRHHLDRFPSAALVDNCPGTGLVVHDDRVVGVRVNEAGVERTVRARSVVLAADGFGASRDMLEQHCPDVVDAPYGGVSTSTGDAIRWGRDLGAATRYMGAFLGSGLMVAGHGTRVNPALPFLGALIVDENGNRFVDETAHGYSALGEIIAQLPSGKAVILWSEQAMAVVSETHLMRESARAGAFLYLEDVDAASRAFGFSSEAVLAAMRELASEGGHSNRDPLQFPLYGARITRGLLTTQGGLVVDTAGRVLREDGTWIEGLYAGGGSAAGISGTSPEGYTSGNGLLTAMGFGWIIGNRLASTHPGDEAEGTSPPGWNTQADAVRRSDR